MNQLLSYLKDKHDARIAELGLFLAQGGIKDIAEYQRVCGVIQGLNTANEFILDFDKRLESDENE